MKLQADKFVEFDLIPWLLSDVYFFINSSMSFIISALPQTRSNFWWTFLPAIFDAKTRVLIKL